MKTSIRIQLVILAALFLAAFNAQAQTVISGPNITTSTWSPAGNPYVVAANCTVPSGNTLTIQPGTIVWMGEGVSLTGNGMIQAAGISAQRITFQAISGGGKWNTIIVNNTVGTNQFEFCDFSGATNALDFRGASQNEIKYCSFSNTGTGMIFRHNSANDIRFCDFQNVTNGVYMTVNANNYTLTTTILNCSFTNCSSQAIYGEAYGAEGGTASRLTWTGTINCHTKNCSFNNSGIGCKFRISGASNYYFFQSWTGFTGYPVTYGQVLLTNRNGTPSDVLYNIFQDPKFVSASDFHLQGSSPCIDAGEGSAANNDTHFPPSKGTAFNDMGAYGGPGAGIVGIESNTAPVLVAIPAQTVDEGALLNFTATATDVDLPAQALTFSLVGAPAGASIHPATGVFAWTPDEAQGPGVFNFTVRVSDGSLTDEKPVAVTVAEVNAAPVLTTIPNQTGDSGVTLTFTAAASDADLPANTLVFSLGAGAPAGATINPASGAFTWTPPVFVEDSSYSVRIIVTDNGSPVLNDYQDVGLQIRGADDNANWRRTHFGSDCDNPAKEATVWGDNADPDGDGTPNILEFMMARNPKGADRENEPTFRVANGQAILTYRETKLTQHGILLLGAVSGDLKSWMYAGISYYTIEDRGDHWLQEIRVPINRQRSLFERLEAYRLF